MNQSSVQYSMPSDHVAGKNVAAGIPVRDQPIEKCGPTSAQGLASVSTARCIQDRIAELRESQPRKEFALARGEFS